MLGARISGLANPHRNFVIASQGEMASFPAGTTPFFLEIESAWHRLAGSADSLAKNVISSQGKMANAMGFPVERAERLRQAHSSL
jgi:hypothetical protein